MQAIEALRAAGANNSTFSDAYHDASEMQRERRAAAATSPTREPANNGDRAALEIRLLRCVRRPIVLLHALLRAASPYYIYSSYYGNPYGYSYYPWGFYGGASIIIADCDFVHHRHHSFDHDGHSGHHDGHFDRAGGFDRGCAGDGFRGNGAHEGSNGFRSGDGFPRRCPHGHDGTISNA